MKFYRITVPEWPWASEADVPLLREQSCGTGTLCWCWDLLYCYFVFLVVLVVEIPHALLDLAALSTISPEQGVQGP
jgi:hypothetical protein